jgi:hypothetical protein
MDVGGILGYVGLTSNCGGSAVVAVLPAQLAVVTSAVTT